MLCLEQYETTHVLFVQALLFYQQYIFVKLLGNIFLIICHFRRHFSLTVEIPRISNIVALQNIEEFINTIFIIITKRIACYASLVDNMRLSFFEADVTLRY